MNCFGFEEVASKIALNVEQSIPNIKGSINLSEYFLPYANSVTLVINNEFEEILNAPCETSKKAISTTITFASIIKPISTCIDAANSDRAVRLLTYLGIFIVYLDDLLDSGEINSELVTSRILPIFAAGSAKHDEELDSKRFKVLVKAAKLIYIEVQRIHHNKTIFLDFLKKGIEAVLKPINSQQHLGGNEDYLKRQEEISGYSMNAIWAGASLTTNKTLPEKYYISSYEFGKLVGWLDDIADIAEDINSPANNICIILAAHNSRSIFSSEFAAKNNLYKTLIKRSSIKSIVQYGIDCYESLIDSIADYDSSGKLNAYINAVLLAHIKSLKC